MKHPTKAEPYSPRIVPMPPWFKVAMMACSIIVSLLTAFVVGLGSQVTLASGDYRDLAIRLFVPSLICAVLAVQNFRMVKHWSRWMLVGVCGCALLSYAELVVRVQNA